jgi:hypothetical protein
MAVRVPTSVDVVSVWVMSCSLLASSPDVGNVGGRDDDRDATSSEDERVRAVGRPALEVHDHRTRSCAGAGRSSDSWAFLAS